MEIKQVLNTTVITEISTKFNIVLRIDDQYDIKVTFLELLLNLNTDDKTWNDDVSALTFVSKTKLL